MSPPESSTEADAPPREASDASSSQGVCASCGAERRGTYCPACGQRHRNAPLSLPMLIRQCVAESFDVERGFLATLVGLTRRPGALVRDFWRGATRRYMNPVRYFLVFLSLAQFVAWQTGMVESAVAGFLDGGDPDAFVSRADATQFVSDYFVLLVGLSLPLVTALHALFSKRTVAENAVLGLYAYGHGALLFAGMTLLYDATGGYAVGVISLLIGPAYYVTVFVAAAETSRLRSVLSVSVALVLGALLYLVLLTVIATLA